MKANTRTACIVFFCAVAVFLIITFPLISDPLNTGIGSGIDPYQYIWNAENFSNRIKGLQNPFYTHQFLAPKGTSLWMHTYTPVIGILNTLINNPFLSVSLALVLSFGFSAAGTYLLSRELGIHTFSAVVIAMMYTFSPYKTAHLTEHHHLLLTGHVPYFMLYFIRGFTHLPVGIKRNGFFYPILCLLLLILSFLSDYYTTAFLLIFGAVYLIWPYAFPAIQAVRSRILWISAVVLIPVIHGLVQFLRQRGVDDKGGFYNSADLAGLWIPPEQSRFYPFDFFDLWRQSAGFKGPNEQVVFIGISLMILTIWVFSAPEKKTGKYPWLGALAILFAILSFPKLKFLEFPLGYSPMSWIHQVPFIHHIRNPGRYFSMVYLFLPLALAIRAESNINFRRYRTRMVAVLLCLGIFIEFWPMNTALFSRKDVPSIIQKLELNPEVKRLVQIPDGVKDGFKGVGHFADEYLLWSVVHQKEIPGAYVSRLPDQAFAKFENDPVLRFVSGTAHQPLPDAEQWRQFLTTFKADAILLHPVLKKEMASYEQIMTALAPFTQKIEKSEGLTLIMLKK